MTIRETSVTGAAGVPLPVRGARATPAVSRAVPRLSRAERGILGDLERVQTGHGIRHDRERQRLELDGTPERLGGAGGDQRLDARGVNQPWQDDDRGDRQDGDRREADQQPREDAPHRDESRAHYAVWIAESFQRLGPTGRVKVQYSSMAEGSLREPSTTAPLVSSTV